MKPHVDAKVPSIAVVIVNWNAGPLLVQCIRSLFESRQGSCRVDAVVVVDNGSAEEALPADLPMDRRVTLVRNDDNRGFAAACNQGAAHVVADYLLFLNPDATIKPDTLDGAVCFLEQAINSSVGICGVRVLDPSGLPSTCCARFPTLRMLLAEALGLDRLMASHLKPRLLTSRDLLYSQPVDQVIGAFFLVRNSLFRLLEGFDERFFLYFEEVDFSLRAKRAGYGSYYLAEAEALHVGGACSARAKSHRLFYLIRSRLAYARKHFGLARCCLLLVVTVTLEPIVRIAGAFWRGSWDNVRDTYRAYLQLAAALAFPEKRWPS